MILLLLLLAPISVLAKEKDKDYRFYYVEKVYSDKFYEKGKNNPMYPFLGDIWYYSEEINTSFEKPSNDSKIVEEIPMVKYQEEEKIRYIMIDQLQSEAKVNFQEFEVFSKNNKIQYEIVDCTACSSDFLARIQNTKLNYEYNYIASGSKLTIDLKKEYFPKDITFKVYLQGAVGNTVSYRITANKTNNINDAYYRYKVDKKDISGHITISQDLKNVAHKEKYENEIKEIRSATIENAKILEKKTEYRYRNKVYQYYKEERHYVEGYYREFPGFIKDEENYVEVEPPEEPKPLYVTEYVDKPVYIKETEPSKTITEYIEKKVPVTITKFEKTPLITEKIKIQEKLVEVPVETFVEKEIKIKEQPKKKQLLQYISYIFLGLILKKMTFFRS